MRERGNLGYDYDIKYNCHFLKSFASKFEITLTKVFLFFYAFIKISLKVYFLIRPYQSRLYQKELINLKKNLNNLKFESSGVHTLSFLNLVKVQNKQQ